LDDLASNVYVLRDLSGASKGRDLALALLALDLVRNLARTTDRIDMP